MVVLVPSEILVAHLLAHPPTPSCSSTSGGGSTCSGAVFWNRYHEGFGHHKKLFSIESRRTFFIDSATSPVRRFAHRIRSPSRNALGPAALGGRALDSGGGECFSSVQNTKWARSKIASPRRPGRVGAKTAFVDEGPGNLDGAKQMSGESSGAEKSDSRSPPAPQDGSAAAPHAGSAPTNVPGDATSPHKAEEADDGSNTDRPKAKLPPPPPLPSDKKHKGKIGVVLSKEEKDILSILGAPNCSLKDQDDGSGMTAPITRPVEQGMNDKHRYMIMAYTAQKAHLLRLLYQFQSYLLHLDTSPVSDPEERSTAVHGAHAFVLRYARAVDQLGALVDEEFLEVERKARKVMKGIIASEQEKEKLKTTLQGAANDASAGPATTGIRDLMEYNHMVKCYAFGAEGIRDYPSDMAEASGDGAVTNSSTTLTVEAPSADAKTSPATETTLPPSREEFWHHQDARKNAEKKDGEKELDVGQRILRFRKEWIEGLGSDWETTKEYEDTVASTGKAPEGHVDEGKKEKLETLLWNWPEMFNPWMPPVNHKSAEQQQCALGHLAPRNFYDPAHEFYNYVSNLVKSVATHADEQVVKNKEPEGGKGARSGMASSDLAGGCPKDCLPNMWTKIMMRRRALGHEEKYEDAKPDYVIHDLHAVRKIKLNQVCNATKGFRSGWDALFDEDGNVRKAAGDSATWKLAACTRCPLYQDSVEQAKLLSLRYPSAKGGKGKEEKNMERYTQLDSELQRAENRFEDKDGGKGSSKTVSHQVQSLVEDDFSDASDKALPYEFTRALGMSCGRPDIAYSLSPAGFPLMTPSGGVLPLGSKLIEVPTAHMTRPLESLHNDICLVSAAPMRNRPRSIAAGDEEKHVRPEERAFRDVYDKWFTLDDRMKRVLGIPTDKDWENAEKQAVEEVLAQDNRTEKGILRPDLRKVPPPVPRDAKEVQEELGDVKSALKALRGGDGIPDFDENLNFVAKSMEESLSDMDDYLKQVTKRADYAWQPSTGVEEDDTHAFGGSGDPVEAVRRIGDSMSEKLDKIGPALEEAHRNIIGWGNATRRKMMRKVGDESNHGAVNYSTARRAADKVAKRLVTRPLLSDVGDVEETEMDGNTQAKKTPPPRSFVELRGSEEAGGEDTSPTSAPGSEELTGGNAEGAKSAARAGTTDHGVDDSGKYGGTEIAPNEVGSVAYPDAALGRKSQGDAGRAADEESGPHLSEETPGPSKKSMSELLLGAPTTMLRAFCGSKVGEPEKDARDRRFADACARSVPAYTLNFL
ncbi:unnamed protein product [Amoebophrya sp. A25]|nr:unnamed protein product [Amoebophrya sp. A25]|eukprot:GSA25T00000407001.1